MNEHLEVFKTRAEAVSAEVHHFKDHAQALAFIQAFLREAGVTAEPGCGAIWAPGSFLEATGREQLAGIAGLGFEVSQAACAAARVGISQLDWGIAGTGTLVQDVTAVAQRLVSSLPLIHLALLGSDRILKDMGSVLQRLHPSQANCISFITGPSRTADIERVLTIGVHGPERLVIVLVDDLEGVKP